MDSSKDTQDTLDITLGIAKRAIRHATDEISKGGTQIENNLLTEKDHRWLDSQIGDDKKGTGMRGEVVSQQKQNMLEDNGVIANFESVISVTSKHKLGNCKELAWQAFDFIISFADSLIKKEIFNAEIFSIKGGDHVFLVLNRDPNSKVEDPTTWGVNAVICDPWSRTAYPAADYRHRLKNFYTKDIYNKKTKKKEKKNFIEDFDPQNQKHTLRVEENLSLDFFRKTRTIDKLQSKFIIKSNELIATLIEHNEQLTAIKEGLNHYYPNDKANVKQMFQLICERINATNDLIKKISLSMQSLPNETSQLKYRDRRSVLYGVFDENKKKVDSLIATQKKGISRTFNVILPGLDSNTISKNRSAKLSDDLLKEDVKAIEQGLLIKTVAQRSPLAKIKLLVEQGMDVNETDHDGNTAILLAAIHGQIDITNYLIEKDAYINHENKKGNTALMQAASHGYLSIVKLLKEKDAFINAMNNDGVTALQLAAANGHTEIVRYLISQGADVNACDLAGNRALSLAAKGGHLDIVKLLVAAKADVNAIDKAGNTPLSTLAMQKHALASHDAIVNYLIDQGANVNTVNAKGQTALHLAAKKGGNHLNIIKLLIAAKADVNAIDKAGNTPIIHSNNLKTTKFLEKNGANINVKNKEHVTPLLAAAKKGHINIVEYLEDKGFALDVTDSQGNTPLMLAAANGHYDMVEWLIDKLESDIYVDINHDINASLIEAIENGHLAIALYLIQKGASLDIIDAEKNSLLILAAKGGHYNIVEWLLKQNADVNDLNKDGCTALIEASRRGHLEIVELLVANENTSNEDINKALFVAAGSNQVRVVEYLLSTGVNIESRNQKGDTPLILAAKGGRLYMVNWLVNHGADVQAFNNDLVSPFMAATISNHLEVVQFLAEKNADIDSFDIYGLTPLMLAVNLGHHEIVKWLVPELRSRGQEVSLEYVNKDDATSLQIAVNNGRLEIAQVLVENHAKLDVIDKYDNTLLHLAADNNHLDMVKWLIEKHNANIHAINSDGLTPFLIAVEEENRDIASYLLNKGININAYTDDMPLPLVFAAEHGHHKMIEFLVKKGADIDAQDSTGATALMIAAKYGNLEMLKRLTKLGANLDIVDKKGNSAILYAKDAKNVREVINFFHDLKKVPQAPTLPLHMQKQRLFANTSSTTTSTTSANPTKDPKEPPVPDKKV